jgi:hypothetical protein
MVRRRAEGASKLNPREGTQLARSNCANPNRPSNKSVQLADRDGTAPAANLNEPCLRGSSGAARWDRIAYILAGEAKRGAEATKDRGRVVQGGGRGLRRPRVRGAARRGGTRPWAAAPRRRAAARGERLAEEGDGEARRVETDTMPIAKQLRSKVSWVCRLSIVSCRLVTILWRMGRAKFGRRLFYGLSVGIRPRVTLDFGRLHRRSPSEDRETNA